MEEVPIRELRNHGGEVIERVERGETVIVTRAGVPVGELRPLPRPRLTATTLLARWRSVPRIDPARLRADIDEVTDPAI
jgi:prevent-host-death family protein